MKREKLIQLIHVASKNAKKCAKCKRLFYEGSCPSCDSMIYIQFSREEYTNLLQTITGKKSCKDLQDFELEKVYEVFRKAGFVPVSNKPEIIKEIDKGNRGTIHMIFERGKEVLGPAYKKRIYGFVRIKYKGKPLNNLSKNELRAVIGWINRMSKSDNIGE
ncbi:MAG: phage protein GemA/Gp16 family protein [Pleomorphochaeta sp.]